VRTKPPGFSLLERITKLELCPVLNREFERRTASNGRGSTAPGRVFVLLW
jgi:hypothetical protein